MAKPPMSGLSMKFEGIVDYKERLTGVDDGCDGNSLIMQYRSTRTDTQYMECRVQMSERLLESEMHKSGFYPHVHPARETVHEFSFSHNFPF
jgi:hypothetical protein